MTPPAILAPDVHRLLESAGYAWNDGTGIWQHPVTKRALAGAMAASMTSDQVREWIAAGVGTRSLF